MQRSAVKLKNKSYPAMETPGKWPVGNGIGFEKDEVVI
jgi:hypothetical protein